MTNLASILLLIFFHSVLLTSLADSSTQEDDGRFQTDFVARNKNPRDLQAQKIFNGVQVTDENEYPQYALLCFGGSTICNGCGGTLIGSEGRHVLTAGHCLRAVPTGVERCPTAVRVGAITNDGGIFRAVTNCVIHPDYPTGPPDLVADSLADIAVLTLASAVTEITPQVINRDINFPDGSNEIPVTAYGFGGIDAANTQSNVLLKASTFTTTTAFCESDAAQ